MPNPETTMGKILLEGVEEWSVEEGALYFEIFQKIKKGHFPRQYVDVFYQNWRGEDLADAYVFARLHCMLNSLELGMLMIEVGDVPGADKDVEGNNQKLAQLPYPFKANFVGGLGGNDGNLEWVEPINIYFHDSACDYVRKVKIRANMVGLEVGYTTSDVTFRHVGMEMGLARWPYDSEFITLWVWDEDKFRQWVERRRELMFSDLVLKQLNLF